MFYEGLKAPQTSVNIKISVNFFSSFRIRMGRVKKGAESISDFSKLAN